jgi:hypothetical protein
VKFKEYGLTLDLINVILSDLLDFLKTFLSCVSCIGCSTEYACKEMMLESLQCLPPEKAMGCSLDIEMIKKERKLLWFGVH